MNYFSLTQLTAGQNTPCTIESNNSELGDHIAIAYSASNIMQKGHNFFMSSEMTVHCSN